MHSKTKYKDVYVTIYCYHSYYMINALIVNNQIQILKSKKVLLTFFYSIIRSNIEMASPHWDVSRYIIKIYFIQGSISNIFKQYIFSFILNFIIFMFITSLEVILYYEVNIEYKFHF